MCSVAAAIKFSMGNAIVPSDGNMCSRVTSNVHCKLPAAPAGGFQRRLLGCTSASVNGKLGGAAAAATVSDVAMLLISHRLRAEPVDSISVYITMDHRDPVLGVLCTMLHVECVVVAGRQCSGDCKPDGVSHSSHAIAPRGTVFAITNPLFAGKYPGAVPPRAPLGRAVRLCGAAELCAALQLMQAWLHPGLAQLPSWTGSRCFWPTATVSLARLRLLLVLPSANLLADAVSQNCMITGCTAVYCSVAAGLQDGRY